MDPLSQLPKKAQTPETLVENIVSFSVQPTCRIKDRNYISTSTHPLTAQSGTMPNKTL